MAARQAGGVTEDPYGDADLVELYDARYPDRPDHAWYRALADELDARTIVDLGCGTGSLTRSLARPGRTVTGVDPSRAMLDHARRQAGGDAVTWILGDASAIPPSVSADLVVCTGNAIMHVGPDELPGAFTSVARALRRDGVLAFESRDPGRREWEEWTREATTVEWTTPLGRLREWVEVTDARGGRVVFDSHVEFADGQHRVSTSVLWFRSADEVERELRAAGFADVVWTGDWQGGPAGDGPVLICRARRS